MLIALCLVGLCVGITVYDIRAKRWGIGTVRVIAGLIVIGAILVYRLVS
jgi:hypothetical protein